ncbi:hypothetical protein [Kitasatospora cathayae]|uniref:DUF3168 domain-containing protein n=1 Tax=Kitasatospora cathayae TaxID=3004092 RepID=A0ABY7Q316_9ACTN|nr:hypothetical protein [Kitasatospora sp. HUAS 3-15]WBP87042.1 hypothetical protein O1G21_15110 [Kitasatospora sp. HUAS 3-15]
MTIPTMTPPLVRQYLYNTLTAQLTADSNDPTSGLMVCYDQPGPGQPNDIVSIGKTHNRLEPHALVGGGGAGWLTERYTVTVTVDVFRGGDDPQYAYARASALCDAVCAAVRADPSLGGLVLVAHPSSVELEPELDPGHMGRRVTGEIEIECLNRI